jgi:DNA-binding NtrC family response regulator
VASILLVEDERQLRRVLALFFEEHGHQVVEAGSGEDALDLAGEHRFDVVLLDVSLPGMSGLETMKCLRDKDPDAVYLVITAFGSIRSAVDAMRLGAFDYVTKPFDNDALLLTVERAADQRRLTQEVASLRSELASRYGFGEIVGTGSAIREVFRLMAKVSATDVSVLILGESGTGKELAARAIHRNSKRAKGPFIAVNCSAIPGPLIESEFFGHERGAFTDARDTRIGRFEQAHGGTLFLDEVGDLALEAQAKLLRVLQDQQVTRLGGTQQRTVNVRVIAATNRDLQADVAAGRFRSDLFWRLDVVSLRLPPLRVRTEDFPALIDHFLDRINRDLGTNVTAVAPEALRVMLAYEWPGNVRELENVLVKAIVLADGPTLRVSDLPPRLRGQDGGEDASWAGGPKTLSEAVLRASERVERAMIQATLSECKGNKTATAESLGINRKTLFTKMRQYGLTSGGEDHEDLGS